MMNQAFKMCVQKTLELYAEKVFDGKDGQYLAGYVDGMRDGMEVLLELAKQMKEEDDKLTTSEDVISNFFSGLKIDETSGNQ